MHKHCGTLVHVVRRWSAVVMIGIIFFAKTHAQTSKPAYQIFDAQGKKVDYKTLLESAGRSEVVLFGELHNNPVCHWLQYELTNDLIHSGKPIVLGAEMLESDGQLILNEYLSGAISEKSFEQEMRLWPNHKTDYQPILNLAKLNHVKFVATNVPRRYANLVYKNGFQVLDTLSKDARKLFAPLPIAYDAELRMYKEMLEMSGGHGGDNLPKAQAVKDATMAHFIYENMEKDKVFIHYHGSYHSDRFEGIYWYLKRREASVSIVTISTVEQINPEILEDQHFGRGDYIICVPERMTKTH